MTAEVQGDGVHIELLMVERHRCPGSGGGSGSGSGAGRRIAERLSIIAALRDWAPTLVGSDRGPMAGTALLTTR